MLYVLYTNKGDKSYMFSWCIYPSILKMSVQLFDYEFCIFHLSTNYGTNVIMYKNIYIIHEGIVDAMYWIHGKQIWGLH